MCFIYFKYFTCRIGRVSLGVLLPCVYQTTRKHKYLYAHTYWVVFYGEATDAVVARRGTAHIVYLRLWRSARLARYKWFAAQTHSLDDGHSHFERAVYRFDVLVYNWKSPPESCAISFPSMERLAHINAWRRRQQCGFGSLEMATF